MRVLSFGSLNFDHIYQMDHFVLPGETMAASDYQRGFGGKGSFYAGPSRNYYVPARTVQAVDTTAAGDTYSGYFLAGISAGLDVKQSMELATIASSMTVQKPCLRKDDLRPGQ